MMRFARCALGLSIAAVGPWIETAWSGDAKAEIDFVTRAANGDLLALAESRLVLERSDDARIKAVAQRLVEVHTAAEAGLEGAASRSGATIPKMLDAAHRMRLAALQGMSGAALDRAYVGDQAEVHSNALTLYADYMLLGDNAPLKAYAIKMIPVAEAQFKAMQDFLNR
jgi:putative membrane protein